MAINKKEILQQTLDLLLSELESKGIPYKDKESDIVMLCPFCLMEGKQKLKLYISKDKGIYHCFRCGNKGHIFNTYLLSISGLSETLSFVMDNIPILTMVEEEISNNKENLKKELKLIKENKEKYFKDIYTKAKDTLSNIRNCQNISLEGNIIKDKLYRKALGYLLNRNINPYILNIYKVKYHICNNKNSKLFGRILFRSFLYTTYEARSFINQQIRYLKSKTPIPDFIFYYIHNNKVLNPYELIKQNKHLEIDNIVSVEGVFDALRLFQYNIPSLSLSGKNNILRSLKFIYVLDLIFNIKINKITYIFDNDVEEKEINEFVDYYNFELKDIFNNLEIECYKLTDYKDINSIPEKEINLYINKLKGVLNNV